MGFLIENHDDADKLIFAATADRRDIQAVADHCAAQRSAGVGSGRDDKLVMTVDGWVINDWCVKRGITFAEFMRDERLQTRFCEDPDNAAFRIWQGKL